MEGQIYKYATELGKFESVSLENLDQLKLLNRVDSKFVLPIDKLNNLLELVSNDYFILEINNQRCFRYDTNYYDSPTFVCYLNHQNQRRNRFKIRHRTYSVNKQSYLEIKRKTNKGKTLKNRREVFDFSTIQESDYDYIESFVDLPSRNLIISSKNSFKRITLASFVSKERITLDFDLQFSVNGNTESLPFVAIAELKRAKQINHSPFEKALKKLKIYPRGFSKYCMGMALLNPTLKQNTFKKNKLYLKKIEHVSHIN
ncbi:MAG: polyphosphate polymerase domain-containing protein [Salinivirgaceae bacterium]|nr:polyphosphate polymerase domain-containing protein [Salinivirgaceae bacterium]